VSNDFSKQKKGKIERPDPQHSSQIERLYVNSSCAYLFPAQQLSNEIRAQKKEQAQPVRTDGRHNTLARYGVGAGCKGVGREDGQKCDKSQHVQPGSIELSSSDLLRLLPRWRCEIRREIQPLLRLIVEAIVVSTLRTRYPVLKLVSAMG